MRKVFLIIVCLVLVQAQAIAQPGAEAAYNKFMELTSMFHGKEPYSCDAIAEVKYLSNGGKPLRDTSTLIYRNMSTYYKSRLVERVEAAEGELLINHELKSASFEISDSIRRILQKDQATKADREFEALLDSNFESKDQEEFKKFVTQQCKVEWSTKDGIDEISFVPKTTVEAPFLVMRIRFGKDSRVWYYEYTTRDVYASDWNGKNKVRVLTTIYDRFKYNNDVPQIPSKLTDFLEWNGWAIKLKKYKNYKLSVL